MAVVKDFKFFLIVVQFGFSFPGVKRDFSRAVFATDEAVGVGLVGTFKTGKLSIS